MILSEKDYRNIAAQIEEGSNSIEYDKGEETLHLECFYETEGSWEDDYYNGTGAYVEFYRRCTITEASVTNEDGVCTPFQMDEKRLEQLVA